MVPFHWHQDMDPIIEVRQGQTYHSCKGEPPVEPTRSNWAFLTNKRLDTSYAFPRDNNGTPSESTSNDHPQQIHDATMQRWPWHRRAWWWSGRRRRKWWWWWWVNILHYLIILINLPIPFGSRYHWTVWTLHETRLATAQKSTSAYCSKVSAHLPSCRKGQPNLCKKPTNKALLYA